MSESATAGASGPVETVTAVIDGVVITVPKGTLIIRAAERIGVEIPRFCDHPLLKPVAACRMCLVEIEGMPKPQPSCAVPLADGMVVKTQNTSKVADKAQRGAMEFLLINHPLDCPVCDKGGECPLQNQAMSHGNGQSRYHGQKRTFPKPVPISSQILLDRERCVSCTRCTRFADQIAGDALIDLQDRGAHQQIGIGEDEPFDSYFSGNTVQICPVGALTSADYRFKARPFDLVSTPTVCEHCAAGCALRTDVRHDVVQRRLAWDDYDVNEEWNCDKGRFAFAYIDSDRIAQPMIRQDGQLRPASWPEAVEHAADGLAKARGNAAVLPGGRVTREDAYAYAKFARVALGTDDIDFRARPGSAEESQFLAALVAGTGLGVEYADLDRAPVVLLVGIEPEEECPVLFLRLRKAATEKGTRIAAVAPWASPGLSKANATVLQAVPGDEATVVAALGNDGLGNEGLGNDGFGTGSPAHDVAAALREPGAVILAGERLATSPGGLSAVAALASQTGAKLAWVPRRAGERGALDAGALAGVLPGGGSITDSAARSGVAGAWKVAERKLPGARGRTLDEVIAAAAPASALVVGGLDPDDLADPTGFNDLVKRAGFVVSLETRNTSVTQLADVVLPVAVDAQRGGSYVNWEGRVRSFPKTLRQEWATTDGQVLAMIADGMRSTIGRGDSASLGRELDGLMGSAAERPEPPDVAPRSRTGDVADLASTEAVLGTWRQLLDLGTLQEDEKDLAGTRRPATARMSAATAAGIGAADGTQVTVAGDSGAVTLPLTITDMPNGVVWIPANSPDSRAQVQLGVGAGEIVRIGTGGGS